MFREILTMLVLVVSADLVLAEETASPTEFGTKIRVPANIGFSTNVSNDKQVVTLLFDNLLVDVSAATQGGQSTRNQTAIQSKVLTVNIPYASTESEAKMILDIRGFQSAGAGSIVRLVACTGDKTKVVNLSRKKSKKVKLKGKCKAEMCLETSADDFQDRVAFTVKKQAANPVVQITLFLIAEHDTDTAGDGGALLAIDSLDLSLAKPAKVAIER